MHASFSRMDSASTATQPTPFVVYTRKLHHHYIPCLTLDLAHVIVSHRTSQQYSSRAPFHSILSARLILGDVLPIRSIIFCARMPGRKVDGMISAFLSDTLITIERFSTLETLGSICKEHL